MPITLHLQALPPSVTKTTTVLSPGPALPPPKPSPEPPPVSYLIFSPLATHRLGQHYVRHHGHTQNQYLWGLGCGGQGTVLKILTKFNGQLTEHESCFSPPIDNDYRYKLFSLWNELEARTNSEDKH